MKVVRTTRWGATTSLKVGLQAKGDEVLNRLLQEFKAADVELLITCLDILASCLKNIPEDYMALKLSGGNIPLQIIEVLDGDQFDERAKELAIEVLDKLSSFKVAHGGLLEKGILTYLNKEFEGFLTKEVKGLKLPVLKKLTRLFQICSNLAINNEIAVKIGESKIIEKMIQIYTNNKDITFLRDIVVKSLLYISSSYEGVLTIEKTPLDLKELAHSSLTSQNPALIESVETIVKNLANEDKVKKAIDEAKKTNFDDKAIIYLSYLSSNDTNKTLFEDQQLLKSLLEALTRDNSSDELKFGVIQIFKELIKSNKKYIDIFVDNKGLDMINKTFDRQANYLLLIQIFDMLVEALKSAGQPFAETVVKVQIKSKSVTFFTKLSTKYEEFITNALTTEKATDSIEFHKSETTRAILQTIKNINHKDVVSLQLALEYSSCKSLSLKLLDFLKVLTDYVGDVEPSADFLSTCNTLMKVFRTSKDIHERIFDTLRKLKYNNALGEHAMHLNWPFIISNVIWKNPSWKYFALYVLRFIENIMQMESVIKMMTQGANTIKLVASIKHFINDEDIKDLEDEEEVTTKDVLTYNEEREIYRKSAVLLEKLIDTSVLETFKSNISKSIEKFIPKTEVITILRAEYAVLTVVNGINYFGSEGLKQDMHKWLEGNVDRIEAVVKNQDFIDKEKLMADCVRSIANFVCITWNEAGKNAYESKEVSVVVFKLFERFLKLSKRPLYSYVMLKAFREWLVNRIETIENATNAERERIYDKESFMMVPLKKKDAIITDVLDSLYLTHTKFVNVEKVVVLNFEVIMLLGYVYPEWKSRAAKNFIPQILDILGSDTLGLNADLKAIELLRQLTGTDDHSDEPNKEILDFAAQNGAVQKICNSISDNGFDGKYIEACKPLLEQLGSNPQNVESSLDIIEKLIKEIEDNNSGKKDMGEISKAVNQLNVFCMVEPLRVHAYNKGQVAALNNLWTRLNDVSANTDKTKEQIYRSLEKGCAIGVSEHIKGFKDSAAQQKVFGDVSANNGIMKNALKSLQRNKRDPELVNLDSKIVNAAFPGPAEDDIRKLAKNLKFQPDLEFIHKSHGQAEDKDLTQEVNTLFMNLSEDQDNNRLEKNLNNALRALNADLAGGTIISCRESMGKILPFVNQNVFFEKFDDMNILDYILKTLKRLHKEVKTKTGKKPNELMLEALGSQLIPDISPNQRKLLEDDINLANSLLELMHGLPEALKAKVRGHKEIVELSDVAVLLNGKPQAFSLYADYLTNRQNIQQLSVAMAVEYSAFLLMKNNKDSFKVQDLETNVDINKSTVSNFLKQSTLSKSLLTTGGIRASTLNIKQADSSQLLDSRAVVLKDNVKSFGGILDLMITPELTKNIIEEYIKSLNKYRPKDEITLAKALANSRLMLALLKGKKSIDLSPYSDKLKKAYGSYLDYAKQGTPNKKLMRFFENIFFKTAKSLADTPKPLKDASLWNSMIDMYIIQKPNIIISNPVRIFRNMAFAQPEISEIKNYRRELFKEADGYFFTEASIVKEGHLNQGNFGNLKKILATVDMVTANEGIKLETYAPTIECLSRSLTFCSELVSQDAFERICSKLVFFEDHANTKLFNDLSNVLMNVINSIRDAPTKIQIFKDKLHPDNIVFSFFDNIEHNRTALVPVSIEVIKHLYDILDNKSPFYDKNLPMKLLEYIGPLEEWSKKPEALIVLARMLHDPSLETLINDLKVNDHIQSVLKDHIASEASTIKNPVKFPFGQVSRGSDDPHQRFCELVSYMLGELSKYQHHAGEYIEESKGLPTPFDLYDIFERYEHIPIMATKLVETTRNAVLKLDEPTFRIFDKKVESLLTRIPPKIQKFKEFSLIPLYLQDILDHLKNFEDQKTAKSMLSRLTTSLVNNLNDDKSKKDKLKDAKGLAEIFKEMSEILADRPLDDVESKTLDVADAEARRMIANDPNAIYTFNNLDLPRYLRLIANSPHSLITQKDAALDFLNLLAKNPDIRAKLLAEPFFVQKSAELINEFVTPIRSYATEDADKLDALQQDLSFMEVLTDNLAGVEYAFDAIDGGVPLIDRLFNVLKGDSNDQKLKATALDVLCNLLKFGDDKELEARVLKELPELFNANSGLYDLTCPLTKLTGVLASKSNDTKQKIVESKILDRIREALQFYPEGKVLTTNTAFCVFELANEFPEVHDAILDSGVMPYLATAFKKLESDKDLHKDTVKALLQLSFKNEKRKADLIDKGFIKGLVPLLIYYSSKSNFDPEMCTLVLKCMANFSSFQQGAETLLNDGAIPTFRNFFKAYCESLPEQNRYMMCTMSNIAYEPQDAKVARIITDKGIELIIEALKYYSVKKDPETTEICIDALANVSSHPQALEYLTKTNVTDVLVDILREQPNDKLCYKSLRCLTNFCKSDPLSRRFMDKGGHSVTIDIFKPFRNDLKNVFQALKLLNLLLVKYEDKLEDFVFAGIPEKIIANFDEKWP